MKRLVAVSLITFVYLYAMGQTVTFTGRDSDGRYAHLSRVVITNHTQGWQETILWPDTSITVESAVNVVATPETCGLVLSQNNPNPFHGATDVLLRVAEAGEVKLIVADVNGQIETTFMSYFEPGVHRFGLTLSGIGIHFLAARKNGNGTSIAMMCNGKGGANGIQYKGLEEQCEPETHEVTDTGD